MCTDSSHLCGFKFGEETTLEWFVYFPSLSCLIQEISTPQPPTSRLLYGRPLPLPLAVSHFSIVAPLGSHGGLEESSNPLVSPKQWQLHILHLWNPQKGIPLRPHCYSSSLLPTCEEDGDIRTSAAHPRLTLHKRCCRMPTVFLPDDHHIQAVHCQRHNYRSPRMTFGCCLALSRVRQHVYQVDTHKFTFSHTAHFLLGNSPTKFTYFSFQPWGVKCSDNYFCSKICTPSHDNYIIAYHSNETRGEDNKQEICRKCIAVSCFHLFHHINKPHPILDICRLPLHYAWKRKGIWTFK